MPTRPKVAGSTSSHAADMHMFCLSPDDITHRIHNDRVFVKFKAGDGARFTMSAFGGHHSSLSEQAGELLKIGGELVAIAYKALDIADEVAS